jgi:hypothetical protein
VVVVVFTENTYLQHHHQYVLDQKEQLVVVHVHAQLKMLLLHHTQLNILNLHVTTEMLKPQLNPAPREREILLTQMEV